MKRKTRNLVAITDLTVEEIELVYRIAAQTKAQIRQGVRSQALAGRTLAMIFEKPSLRTRMSFWAAMVQAGGQATDIQGAEIGLGKRESVKDVAQVMSRYVDVIMIRTFAHKNVEMLARYAAIPVINGLSDYAHPCQALADVFTIREKLGSLEGVNVTFVGDGNNVSRSLAMLCSKLGMNFTLSAPPGHELEPELDRLLEKHGGRTRLQTERDPRAAVRNAHIVYTDVWASMGQESEAEERRKAFLPYQINAELMEHAPKGALIMHCLPAHRGDEITDEVIDSPNSIVYDQAENRLHAQKGLLFFLLGVEGA